MLLKKKMCKACEDKDIPILTNESIEQFHLETPDWNIVEDNKKITRIFQFKNFVSAIDFINAVADIAEAEGHHPDIECHYNKVTLSLSTHSVGRLTENDFIVASKIDEMHTLGSKYQI